MSGLLGVLEDAHKVVSDAQDILRVADQGHWPSELAAATSLAADWLADADCVACEANGAIEIGHDEHGAGDVLCVECGGQGCLAGLAEAQRLVAELVELVPGFTRISKTIERLAVLLNGPCPGCGGLSCDPAACRYGKRSG